MTKLVINSNFLQLKLSYIKTLNHKKTK